MPEYHDLPQTYVESMWTHYDQLIAGVREFHPIQFEQTYSFIQELVVHILQDPQLPKIQVHQPPGVLLQQYAMEEELILRSVKGGDIPKDWLSECTSCKERYCCPAYLNLSDQRENYCKYSAFPEMFDPGLLIPIPDDKADWNLTPPPIKKEWLIQHAPN